MLELFQETLEQFGKTWTDPKSFGLIPENRGNTRIFQVLKYAPRRMLTPEPTKATTENLREKPTNRKPKKPKRKTPQKSPLKSAKYLPELGRNGAKEKRERKRAERQEGKGFASKADCC